MKFAPPSSWKCLASGTLQGIMRVAATGRPTSLHALHPRGSFAGGLSRPLHLLDHPLLSASPLTRPPLTAAPVATVTAGCSIRLVGADSPRACSLLCSCFFRCFLSCRRATVSGRLHLRPGPSDGRRDGPACGSIPADVMVLVDVMVLADVMVLHRGRCDGLARGWSWADGRHRRACSDARSSQPRSGTLCSPQPRAGCSHTRRDGPARGGGCRGS